MVNITADCRLTESAASLVSVACGKGRSRPRASPNPYPVQGEEVSKLGSHGGVNQGAPAQIHICSHIIVNMGPAQTGGQT